MLGTVIDSLNLHCYSESEMELFGQHCMYVWEEGYLHFTSCKSGKRDTQESIPSLGEKSLIQWDNFSNPFFISETVWSGWVRKHRDESTLKHGAREHIPLNVTASD